MLFISVSRFTSARVAELTPFLILTSWLCMMTPAYADNHDKSEKQPGVMKFGLLPSESPVSKFNRYAPLRDYLAKNTGMKYVFETAPNFKEFKKRTLERRYDILETAPHFVPPAVDSGKYDVITTIIQPLSAQVIVRNDSKIKNISQLKNKTVATPSPQAIITKIGKDVLKQHHLHEGKNISYKNYKTHNGAYEAVLAGSADAAVISINMFNKARKRKEPLRSIGESKLFPNMSMLAAKDLPEERVKLISRLLTDLSKHEEGKAILKMITYPGYKTTNIDEFKSLREYMKK